MKLLVYNLLSLEIAYSYTDFTGTGNILGEGCSKVLEAGYFLYLFAVHGDICPGFGSAFNPDL
ncbi:hypothetical protein DPMN_098670 [Dreissena polymorpha]|uniref:Uncharacterized protein n=1 Tax=Dreissena polymorpha TaxID=45954 RepID=A0A9D4LDH4_DREPO|nr:hypothetical protein DPMN_098670 [Dreissena polymorpha]